MYLLKFHFHCSTQASSASRLQSRVLSHHTQHCSNCIYLTTVTNSFTNPHFYLRLNIMVFGMKKKVNCVQIPFLLKVKYQVQKKGTVSKSPFFLRLNIMVFGMKKKRNCVLSKAWLTIWDHIQAWPPFLPKLVETTR